ncbi:T9SS type A sorting domain-containing protein, partial [bacterium]|nr:T9SS type A sorting domain-containing protein [bacterium]
DPGDFCLDDFSSATITNTPSGGAPPYTYEWWVNGGLQDETGATLTVTDNAVGSYVIVSTVTDSQDCVSDICEVIYEIIPNPVCEILAPDPLPSCGTDAYQLCATEDNLDYTYSWELISAPAGWELVPPTDGYCVIYNTGNLGEATFELTVTDQYGCEGTCEVTFGCEPSGEFCSFTQGFYGNAGGDWNGMRTLEILDGLITPADPLVLGVLGTRSVTFEDGSELCIIARLPGDGPDMPLPDFGSQVINPFTCQTDPPLPTRKGRFSNGFLIRTIALSLNVRLGDDGDLATVGLCFFMTTQAALCGDDGICGTSDDIPDPGPDGINGTGDEDIVTFYIPQAVIDALGNLGLEITVGGLLELANRGLAGMDTDVASLSEIKAAVIAINEAFDDCRFLIGCSDAPSGRGIPNEFGGDDGKLRVAPLAFALSPNTPNPVREGTSISFALPEASRVKIAVYNLRGQVVSVIEDGIIPAGYHTAHWHSGGHAAAAGVYFYRMQAVGMESGETFSHSQKMVVVR